MTYILSFFHTVLLFLSDGFYTHILHWSCHQHFGSGHRVSTNWFDRSVWVTLNPRSWGHSYLLPGVFNLKYSPIVKVGVIDDIHVCAIRGYVLYCVLVSFLVAALALVCVSCHKVIAARFLAFVRSFSAHLRAHCSRLLRYFFFRREFSLCDIITAGESLSSSVYHFLLFSHPSFERSHSRYGYLCALKSVLGYRVHVTSLNPPGISSINLGVSATWGSGGVVVTRGSESVVYPVTTLPSWLGVQVGCFGIGCPVVTYMRPNRNGFENFVTYYTVERWRLSIADSWGFKIHSTSRPQVLESVDAIARYSDDRKTVHLHLKATAAEDTISSATFASCMARYRMAKNPALGIIATVCGASASTSAVSCIMSLAQANAQAVSWLDLTLPYIGFQALYDGIITDSFKEMSVRAFTNVVYSAGGFGIGAPHISKSNEYYTVDARILGPSNSNFMNHKYHAFALDFVRALATNPLSPLDHDSVVEQMDRPSQRHNREQVDSTIDILWSTTKSMFTKTEAVQVGKPARNIVTLSAERLYRACAFMLAASQHMRTVKWWVWGVGSGATARLYSEACTRHPKMMESDFSKFDASLNEFFVAFNRLLMRVMFPDHYDEWSILEQDVLYQMGSTTCGLKFQMRHGRLSGCNETTFFNTVDQAFIQYTSFRNFGKNHDEAWGLLNEGLYGGDDGITPFIGQDLESTVKEFGMKVESRIFDSTSPCRFLGRIYPNGRDSTDSYQDLAEFIKTMHLVNLGSTATLEQGLVNMANGLRVTDYNTPLIAEFIRAVDRAYPQMTRMFNDYDRWWVEKMDFSDPFTLTDYRDPDLLFPWTASVLGCSPDDIYALRDFLKTSTLYVGTQLPVVACSEEFHPKQAFEILGIPIGPLTRPPVLPKMSKSEEMEARAKIDDLDLSLFSAFTTPNDPPERQSSDNRKCYNCGSVDHYAWECPSKITCRICGESGHIAKKCTKKEEELAAIALDHPSLASYADKPALGRRHFKHTTRPDRGVKPRPPPGVNGKAAIGSL